MKSISWIIVHWEKLGRKLWFKTANVPVKNIQMSGTYRIRAKLGKRFLSGVGTFMEKKWVFEAHFFDFNQSIYWRKIEIFILEKIRENRAFSSLDDLISQIQKDVDYAKNNPIYVMSFGTFDIVHKWHAFYLQECKKFGDMLVTIIARDANVIRFKGKPPYNHENKRKADVEKLKIANIVELWDIHDPLKWIEKYNPKIVCIGYDQKWFISEFEKYLQEKKLDITIEKIAPFQQNTYKSSLIKQKNLKKTSNH